MKPVTSILRQSRLGLATLGATAILGLFANWSLTEFAQKSKAELTVAESEKGAAEAELAVKLADLKLFQQNFSVYENLRQQGLAGSANRDNWVDELLNAHQRSKLPDTLGYALLAPKPMAAANAAGTLAPVEMHELELSLDAIHETELIKFLDNYQRQVKGRYRLQSCALSSPQSSGLSAKCNLYFFNQPLTPASTARAP